MKNLIYLLLLFFLLACKKEVENSYFTSDELYDKVIESVDKIHLNISESDKTFYVFNRYDTLIVMSSEAEDILRPTYTIEKLGFFNYNGNKIIITKPYKPEFDLINKENKLTQMKEAKPPYYDGNDYQKGFVYKVKDLHNLELIDQGNLVKYFKPMKEYEIPIPPTPKE